MLELNVRFDPLLGPRLPVAAVENRGKQVVSEDSSATVTALTVAAPPAAIATAPLTLPKT